MNANDIHNYSDGKFAINTQSNMSDPANIAGQIALNYTTKDFKTEENTVYDNKHRVERAAAVASVFTADYRKVEECARFDFYAKSINQDSTDNNAVTSYLNKIGYINTKDVQARNNMLEKAVYEKVNQDGSATKMGHYELSSKQKQELTASGTCTVMDASGHPVQVRISGQSQQDVMSIMAQGNNSAFRYDSFLNAGTKNVKLQQMAEMRQYGITYLKKEGGVGSVLDKFVKSGSSDELKQTHAELEKERQKILNSNGNKKDDPRLAEIDRQKKLLSEHEKMLGNSDNQGTRRSQSRSYGLSIMQGKVLGSDMNSGYRFYKQSATLANKAVHLTVQANSAMAMSAMSRVERRANASNISDEMKNKISEIAQNRRDAYAMQKKGASMRKQGRYGEFKRERRTARMTAKNERSVVRDNRLKEKQQNNPRIQRKLQRSENKRTRRISRNERRDARYIAKEKFLQNAKEWVKRRKLVQLYNRFINPIVATFSQVKKIVAKFVLKYIAPAIASFVLFLIKAALVADVLAILISFFYSDENGNKNYVQTIVDDTAEELGDGYFDIAKRDAATHYSDIDNAPVSGYLKDGTFNGDLKINWWKAATEGNIGTIKNWDGTRELASINSNLLPITSMMHYRFSRDVNKDNWLTAKAYVYYMYVVSHEVEGYEYRDLADCDKAMLYSTPIDYTYWNPDNHELTRPHAICSNIYLHGYSTDMSYKLNEIAMSMCTATYKMTKYLGIDNEKIDATLGKTQGIWIDEIPSDNIDGIDVTCNNYLSLQYGTDEETDANCGLKEHGHTKEEYQLTCNIEEHTHGDGNCNADACTHVCNEDCCDVQGKHFIHNNNACTHEHDASCCSKSEHTHDSAPDFEGAIYSDDPIGTQGCYTTTCGIPVHQHIMWTSPLNPGCWKTVYICKGHCGGHIEPVINLRVDNEWKSLMEKDGFVMPVYIKEGDFNKNTVDLAFKYDTLSEWNSYWDKTMQAWFSPSRKYTLTHAGDVISDSFSEWTNSWVEKNFDIDLSDKELDIFAFNGWTKEDGSINQMELLNLESLYGKTANDFEDGVELWEEMNVVFPLGGTKPLSSAQKQMFMAAILEAYPDLSDSRKAAIEQAFDYVGKFWYDLKNPGTFEAESGRIDCSGFISSVLHHSIGFGNDWTASGYSQAGDSRPSDLIPGDILSKNNNYYMNGWNGDGQPNHVIMYIGYLEDGPDGSGTYIVDCSSSQGGSALRILSDVSKYNYCYRGCY